MTNVNNMSHMFCGCSSLQSIPDLSKWNTTNVKDMSNLFSYCTSLQTIPIISNKKIKIIKGNFIKK